MLEDKVTEKVYCYDHPSAYNNHDALAIAAMANKSSGVNAAEMMAAMNGGMGANQWMNNPFIYLVFLMMWFGRTGSSLLLQIMTKKLCSHTIMQMFMRYKDKDFSGHTIFLI